MTAVKIMHAVCSLCVFAIIVSSIYRTGELVSISTSVSNHPQARAGRGSIGDCSALIPCLPSRAIHRCSRPRACCFADIPPSLQSNSATLAMIAVNVFVAAPLLFYDYRLHKSGEPKRSMRRMVALSMFIVDVGTFIIEDSRRMVAGPEMEAVVAECEWRFGQIMWATSGATLRLEDEMEAEDRWTRWKVDHRLCGGRVGEVDGGIRRDDAADPSKLS